MISVVMTHYNRPQQLLITLRSLEWYVGKQDFEVVIVDDASHPGKEARIAVDKIPSLPVRLIEVEEKNKWWMNPCVPFNMGIRASHGDIVVLQNAECVHLGDLLKHISKNLLPNQYISFPCFSTKKHHHEVLRGMIELNSTQPALSHEILAITRNLTDGEWFNSVDIPKGYHFCSAIHRKDLDRAGGGFNEIFASGYCFDDDALLLSIRRAGIQVVIPPHTKGLVVHQWHEKERSGPCPEWYANKRLLEQMREGTL